MIITTYPVFQADKTGEQFISCTYEETTCGCKIIGGGTLQQPLKIKYCEKHEPIEVAILQEKFNLAKMDIKDLKDKLHRRNMQIKDLKEINSNLRRFTEREVGTAIANWESSVDLPQ